MKTKLEDKKIDIPKIKNMDDNNNFRLPIICDTDTLRTLMRKKAIRVVDVRKAEDYQREHIPTAVSLPLAVLLGKDTPSGIVDILENLGISDKMPVVIYDDTFGALAARVAWTFQYVGHTNTALLEVTQHFSKDTTFAKYKLRYSCGCILC